ncbi:MAG: beta-glucosidase [Prevotella sp.]|jgi:beta-glucosidase
MKLSCILLTLMVSLSVSAQQELQLREDNVDEILSSMTLHEKAELVVGVMRKDVQSNIGMSSFIIPGAAGSTRSVSRLGIPSIVLADGPAGLRIKPHRPYDSHTYYCTHFPIGTCLASSWNTALVSQVGAAIGNEVHEYGVDVLLAPGANIHRNPLCGRNFEYYSEDPVLAGNIAAAYINGVQSQNVGATIKHFAFNNQETSRFGTDARVSERVAREIYLKAFEIAIKNSRPWCVMSSYNKVNGILTSENKDLLTTLLRDEWGYEGTVMSDWFGGMDPVARGGRTDRVANMKAGNNLIEPGEDVDVETIESAVKDGRLSMKDLDVNVRRVLQLIVKTPRFKGYEFSNQPDLKAHALITRHSATEGIVLLENRGVLPFAPSVKHVALFGVGSYEMLPGGTGSGNVNRAYTVSLVEGMRNHNYIVDESLLNRYTQYIKRANDSIAKLKHEWWQHAFLAPDAVPSDEVIRSAASQNDVAVVTLRRQSGEDYDRSASDFKLKQEELQLIQQVTNAFKALGKKTVVVLNVGGVIETSSWKNTPDAVLLPWQCGQEIGNSVADVLSGASYPSGRLPMTWPNVLTDVPSTSNFPLDGLEMHFKDSRWANYKDVRNVGYTCYEEGLNVGYRYFDTAGKGVSYPFGYGLSYTTFSCSPLNLQLQGDSVIATVTIANTGNRPGKQVAELYVAAPRGKVVKPVHELKSFAKTRELKPGESQTLRMAVNRKDLASFVEKSSSWVVDAGTYTFQVGFSSQDIQTSASIRLKGFRQRVPKILRLRNKF